MQQNHAAAVLVLVAGIAASTWLCLNATSPSRRQGEAPEPTVDVGEEAPRQRTIAPPRGERAQSLGPGSPREPRGSSSPSPGSTRVPHAGLEVQVLRSSARGAAAVPGARIHVRLFAPWNEDPRTPLQSATLRADEDGRARVELRAAGKVVVTANTAEECALAEAHVRSGAARRLIVLLESASSISGRVTDGPNGNPIEGAEVTFVRHTVADLPPVETDAGGRFRIGPWQVNLFQTLEISAGGYGREFVELVVRGDGSWVVPARFGVPESSGPAEPFVEIHLTPEKVVTGTVVDAQGDAVVGGRIEALGLLLVSENGLQPDEAHGTTGPAGTFALAGLRSDVTHALGIRGPECRRTIEVGPGTCADLGVVRLDSARRLEGSIADRWGRPAVGSRVELLEIAPTEREVDLSTDGGANPLRDACSRQPLFRWRTRTDATGSFAFEPLPAGRMRLVVRPLPFRSYRRDVEVTGSTVLEPFVLDEPLVPLRGRLTLSGQPGRLLVTISDPIGTVLSVVETDAEGRYELTGLREGKTYLLSVHELRPRGGPEVAGAADGRVLVHHEPFVFTGEELSRAL